MWKKNQLKFRRTIVCQSVGWLVCEWPNTMNDLPKWLRNGRVRLLFYWMSLSFISRKKYGWSNGNGSFLLYGMIRYANPMRWVFEMKCENFPLKWGNKYQIDCTTWNESLCEPLNFCNKSLFVGIKRAIYLVI